MAQIIVPVYFDGAAGEKVTVAGKKVTVRKFVLQLEGHTKRQVKQSHKEAKVVVVGGNVFVQTTADLILTGLDRRSILNIEARGKLRDLTYRNFIDALGYLGVLTSKEVSFAKQTEYKRLLEEQEAERIEEFQNSIEQFIQNYGDSKLKTVLAAARKNVLPKPVKAGATPAAPTVPTQEAKK